MAFAGEERDDFARPQASDIRLPDISLLFDEGWYLGRNPDVARAGVDPFVHFIEYGAWEGRNPCPLFDLEWYGDQHGFSGLDALDHYLLNARPGLDPHPLFDTGYYLSRNPGVAESGMNPLVHYRSADPATVRDPHPLFDHPWYLATNPDVASAGVNPLEHYLTFGAYEGRNPNLFFDSRWYLTQYKDVGEVRVNPLTHYCRIGVTEGRDPSNDFDSDWYLSRNSDVVRAGLNPLAHYIHVGRHEGRLPLQQERRAAAVAAAEHGIGSLATLEPALAELSQRSPLRTMERVSPVAFGRRFAAWQALFGSLSQTYDVIVFVPGGLAVGQGASPSADTRDVQGRINARSVLVVATEEIGFAGWKDTDLRVLSDFDCNLSEADRADLVALLIYFVQPKSVFNLHSKAAWRAIAERGGALSLVATLEAAIVARGAGEKYSADKDIERALPHLASTFAAARSPGDVPDGGGHFQRSKLGD